MSRSTTTVFGAILALALSFSIFSLVLRPDPGTKYFAKAQHFESRGEIGLAIQHYLLIANTQPNSFYAPRALMRAADLRTAAAGRTDNKTAYKEAMALYQRVAESYPADPLAVEAMLNAGQIAAEHLDDRAAAKRTYDAILERFGKSNPDLAATATLKLGRLALDGGDGKTSVSLLQRVLQRWPNLANQAAEAQYHLGVAYETLMKNKPWATRAYEAVLARYPQSTWAGEAQERLGLIVFSDTRGQRPARRVMIDIQPLPDEGATDGSLWSALHPVLAARGVATDELTLRGLSLTPFYAGFDPKNPGRVVSSQADAFETVVANSGLRFSVKSGGNEREALGDLQSEIDAARAPLLYMSDGQQKYWSLAVGYDTDRGEVMLQKRGARFDTLAARSFASQWKVKSPLGNEFTLLTFTAPGRNAPKPSLTPTPMPTAVPGKTPIPVLLAPPSFVWELPQLDEKQVHQRTLRRAATLLARPREGGVLLNTEALRSVVRELEQVSQGSTPTPTPVVTPTPGADTVPEPEADPSTEPTVSPYEPTPTPAGSNPTADRDLARIKQLMAFFGAPVQEWSNRRRDAAAYLELCGRKLRNNNLTRAAEHMRDSADALTEAANRAPSPDSFGAQLSPELRGELSKLTDAVRKAYEAERATQRKLAGL